MKRNPFFPADFSNRASINYLLVILKDARAATLYALNKVSEQELYWQPFKNWNSISVLLLHIASVADVLRIEFVENRTLTKEEATNHEKNVILGKFLPEVLNFQPLGFYLNQLNQSQKRLETAITQLTPDEFYQKREGYDPENGCNLAWVLYHIAEDEINHRGQITLLRKMYKERFGSSEQKISLISELPNF